MQRLACWVGVVLVLAGSGRRASAPRLAHAPAERIVSVADIHGAGPAFAAILQTAGMVDEGHHWIGGSAHLVQLGDILDRGPDVRMALDLLQQLQREAAQAGGDVHVVMGNHEAMCLLRVFRDTTPEGLRAFASADSDKRRESAYVEYATLTTKRGNTPLERESWMASHPPGLLEYVEATAPDGPYGRWIRRLPAMVVVGRTAFLHGGLDPAFASTSTDAVNQRLAGQVRDWDAATAAMVKAGLILPFFTFEETLAAARAEIERSAAAGAVPIAPDLLAHLHVVDDIGASWLVSPEGPLWFRGFATWPESAQSKIDTLLKTFDVDRFVVGHSVLTTHRITGRFDHRVFLTDTGMLSSHFTNGRASALELTDGHVTAIYSDAREALSK